MADTSTNNAVSGGAGPGDEFAKPRHWSVILGILMVVALGIMAALIWKWPCCEERAACLDGECRDKDSTSSPTVSALPKSAPAAPSAASVLAGAAGEGGAGGETSQPAPQASGSADEASPLEILSISPTSGPLCGGTDVTIKLSGRKATDRVHVTFGGLAATTRDGPDQQTVTATSPQYREATVPLTVRVGEKSASLKEAFAFTCPDRTQTRLLLLVLLAGALGGTLHALRSLFYFIGNRNLRLSWLPMYLVLPVSSAAIAAVFFLVFVGGLFDVQAGNGSNYFVMVGVSALVGMFSQQAVEKLKKISEAILTATPPSADADGASTFAIGLIEPENGSRAGGESVRITGSGFDDKTTVMFGATEAAVVWASPTELKVKTPPGPIGKVSVYVTDKDENRVARPNGFEYRP